jgi:hypothetical protein
MSLEQVLTFIRPELLIVVAVCYGLGMFLKQAPHVQDWIIPFAILIFSIILCIAYLAFVIEKVMNIEFIIIGIMQGILCASVAVFGNQLLKQITKKEGE